LIEFFSSSPEETIAIGGRIAHKLRPLKTESSTPTKTELLTPSKTESSTPSITESLTPLSPEQKKQSSVIALKGVLGSGKTCLTKGIANGLGIKETITSPTYTIINEYLAGKGLLYHIDAYRLLNSEDFDQLGGRELLSSGSLTIIEWSDRIEKSIPEDAIKIEIKITGDQSRIILISGLELG